MQRRSIDYETRSGAERRPDPDQAPTVFPFASKDRIWLRFPPDNERSILLSPAAIAARVTVPDSWSDPAMLWAFPVRVTSDTATEPVNAAADCASRVDA